MPGFFPFRRVAAAMLPASTTVLPASATALPFIMPMTTASLAFQSQAAQDNNCNYDMARRFEQQAKNSRTHAHLLLEAESDVYYARQALAKAEQALQEREAVRHVAMSYEQNPDRQLQSALEERFRDKSIAVFAIRMDNQYHCQFTLSFNEQKGYESAKNEAEACDLHTVVLRDFKAITGNQRHNVGSAWSDAIVNGRYSFTISVSLEEATAIINCCTRDQQVPTEQQTSGQKPRMLNRP